MAEWAWVGVGGLFLWWWSPSAMYMGGLGLGLGRGLTWNKGTHCAGGLWLLVSQRCQLTLEDNYRVGLHHRGREMVPPWNRSVDESVIQLVIPCLVLSQLELVFGSCITRVDPWGPDRRKWLFSEVRGGIWTPHSHVLIKISADKRPLNQFTVKNLFFSLIIKTFCH